MAGNGKLVIISAPSGAGKSTVIKEMLKLCPDFIFSISATTREKRPHETDGKEYYFITAAEFEEKINRGEFLEWAKYVGNYYGTPQEPIMNNLKDGKTVLLDIEVQGARQVMEKTPYAISFFIVPPDMQELERRLRGRGTDSEDALQARLRRARQELDEKDKYNYIIINDKSSRAAQEIISRLQ